MADLNRFRAAQNGADAGFETAIAELKAGQKHSHWIWYVFPQLAGLGTSSLARFYGLSDAAEAVAYLSDRDLGLRLVIAANAAVTQVAKGIQLESLMGSKIDTLKLVSSMTLFETIARQLGPTRETSRLLLPLAEQLLAAAEREGYPRCSRTLAALATTP